MEAFELLLKWTGVVLAVVGAVLSSPSGTKALLGTLVNGGASNYCKVFNTVR